MKKFTKIKAQAILAAAVLFLAVPMPVQASTDATITTDVSDADYAAQLAELWLQAEMYGSTGLYSGGGMYHVIIVLHGGIKIVGTGKTVQEAFVSAIRTADDYVD